jgi:hypothetical protein
VDPGSRWQTRQLHLRSALAAREVGDITLALQEVDAALAIDPDYLAARLLRKSLADRQPPLSPRQELPDQAPPSQLEPQPPDIASARTAIHLSGVADARDALEVVEFDPAWPVIPEIAAEVQPGLDRVKRRHPMLLVALASGVAGLMVGTLAGLAIRPHRELATADAVRAAPPSGSPTFSVQPPVVAPRLSAELLEPAASAAIAQDAIVRSRTDSLPSPPAAPPPPRARIEPRPPAAERIFSAVAVAKRPSPASPASPDSPPPPAPAVERPSATPAPVERVPEAPATVSPRVDRPSDAPPIPAADDPALIRDVLQRYRRAYNALDARLAHTVYPGVDEVALTHAFEGLRSQSLEFEACSVDALAESARAVCRGSARYVPRIGSREPRAETRVWTFKLRKGDGDWTIESAWTSR